MSGLDDGPDDGLDDGLAGLLAGVRPPDVYRWHALATPSEVRDRVTGAGWRFAHLGGWPVTDRRAALAGLGAALDLPAYYGQNLDALSDCLRDLPGPTLLVWDFWSRLARRDGDTLAAVLAVLADRARTPGSDRSPAFAVLLWGEGPATGTSSL